MDQTSGMSQDRHVQVGPADAQRDVRAEPFGSIWKSSNQGEWRLMKDVVR
jgi:hypothetical protein